MGRRFNINYILARWGAFKPFWWLRYQWLRLDFKRLRGIFHIKISTDNARTEASALKVLARGSFLPIFFAALAAFLLYLFDRNTHVFTQISFLDDNAIGRYLSSSLDEDAYVQLLTTVAAVTGVFLGLYFTAVSTVIANAYSTVPHDIRELLIKDRLGNVYVKTVSFLTALSVFLLGMSAGGGNPLHLVPPLVIILSGFAVFAFARLGQRAFFLSDPTLLSHTLSYELTKWAERSTSKGWQWKDINFQEHYRKQAAKSISTLSALAQISGKKPELQGDSYPRLLNRLIFTIRHYHNLKPLIPSASRWFGKKYQHKQWYLTESTELDMAAQTDSALQPNEVPDINWVEDELFGTVFNALKQDADTMNYEALYTKLTGFPDLFDDIGRKWMVADGETWFEKATADVIGKIISQDPGADAIRPAYTIAVADIFAALPLSLELGFIKALRELKVPELRKQIAKTNWTKASAPYIFPLPVNTIKALEEIHEGALFEQSAKAPYPAPAWYVIEYAFNNLDWKLFRQWEQLMSLMERWYFDTGKKFADAGLHKQATAVYTRALELAWKLDSHIETLKMVSTELREDSRLDFKRPEWDWDNAQQRVTKFRTKAIDEMAKSIPNLLPELPDSDTPDYFGQAVHKTGEACYDALVDGDGERFKTLFGPYFVGILGAFDKVRPQVTEWEIKTALTWLAEPIIDLFEISGYAYILAEFHNKPELWQSCERVWNGYLSGERREQSLQLLAGLSYHYQNLLGVLTPRATLRSQRQIRLGRLFHDLPRQSTTDPFRDPPVQHQSAFIRSIAPIHDMFMFTDAIDVFTVKYLMKLPEATNLNFGVSSNKVDHIQRDLEDEEEV